MEMTDQSPSKLWGILTAVFFVLLSLPVLFGMIVLLMGLLPDNNGPGAIGLYFIWIFSAIIAGIVSIPGLFVTIMYVRKSKPKGIRLAASIAVLVIAGNALVVAVPLLLIWYVLPLFLM